MIKRLQQEKALRNLLQDQNLREEIKMKMMRKGRGENLHLENQMKKEKVQIDLIKESLPVENQTRTIEIKNLDLLKEKRKKDQDVKVKKRIV